MSVENPTLADFVDNQRAEIKAQREAALAQYDHAVYRCYPDETHEIEPENSGCCKECGEPVPDPEVRRVLGDEYGRVSYCPNCTEHDTYGAAAQSNGRVQR